MMKVTLTKHPSPKGEITYVRIENSAGASVTLSTLGAGIVEVCVPDRSGVISNVALAYSEPASYLYDGPCLGKTPGRYANRIAKGRFSIDGKPFTLAVNNGPNALHGGPEGFQNQIWELAAILPDGVRMRYVSADGEEGYPGRLTVEAVFRWSESNTLSIEYTAATTQPTVVNLTNHAYWNLDGADAGSVLGHKLRIKASGWLPTDSTLIPTGDISDVAHTPMDFTAARRVGEDIEADFPALVYGKGYDNCWAVDGWHEGRFEPEAVTLCSEESGRCLTVGTDQPGVQVYTGNWLAGSPLNASGRQYADYDGIAIEAQGFPDAPNHPGFPQQTLRPGDIYRRLITFSFGVMK